MSESSGAVRRKIVSGVINGKIRESKSANHAMSTCPTLFPQNGVHGEHPEVKGTDSSNRLLFY